MYCYKFLPRSAQPEVCFCRPLSLDAQLIESERFRGADGTEAPKEAPVPLGLAAEPKEFASLLAEHYLPPSARADRRQALAKPK